jgi:hypothetical protein
VADALYGIKNTAGSASVTSSEIKDHFIGILHEGGNTAVSNSHLHSNSDAGVNNATAVVIDAKHNYWGDPLGPHHPTLNPTGIGDRVSDNVDFVPWLTAAPGTLDPLLLQYEPILYLHPDENYRPMNVEAFIEASTLWDGSGGDTLLISRGDVTVDDISVTDSGDWYLAFSSDQPGTLDPAAAKTRYDSLSSVPTYYGYRTEDSFIDNNGNLYKYIVLQYWHFYAFNDWEAQTDRGLNNHEGDWETVMVFLDADTKEPRYVAYSAHLNDGNPNNNPIFQYDSVRRRWNEIEVNGNHPKSYVALGSHANYPNNGNNGEHAIVPLILTDFTSSTGFQIEVGTWGGKFMILSNSPAWLSYEGGWGADVEGVGTQGPQGPQFLAPKFGGSTVRFFDPIKWAGIDKVNSQAVSTPTNFLNFINQLVSLAFANDLPTGTNTSVDLHDEIISFGINIGGITLLPHFWDIESSLANGTFEATVDLQYDPDEVAALGIDEGNLGVFLYSEASNVWEQVASAINAVANSVSFVTTHFSRYAIGEQIQQTPVDLIQQLKEKIEGLDIKKSVKKNLLNDIKKIERRVSKGEDRKVVKDIHKLEDQIKREQRKGRIGKESAEELLDLLTILRELFPLEENKGDRDDEDENDKGGSSRRGDKEKDDD